MATASAYPGILGLASSDATALVSRTHTQSYHGDDVLRKSRGLGMLLSSIGGNKDEDDCVQVTPTASKAASTGKQGFDLASADFCGWDDISSNPQFDEATGGSENIAEKSKSKQVTSNSKGGGTAADSKKAPEKSKSDQGKSGNDKPGGGRGTKQFQDEEVYGMKGIDRWADIREYNDDHDAEWFQEENGRLAELYGGKFIYVKYLDSQPGRIGYFCQICSAEMNAKKSLELHCNGMKHLKRKDQFEKGDRELEMPKEVSKPPPERAPYHSNRGPVRNNPYGPPPSWPGRGGQRRDSYGDRAHYNRGPPSPNYRNDDRGYYGHREREYHDRYSDNGNNDDHYRKEPYRPPYDRDQYDRRSPPDAPRDYRDSGPGPMRRDPGDRYSRERHNPYNRRDAPPPPIISNMPNPEYGGAPRPPVISQREVVGPGPLFDGISDGSCHELLQRLAACRVKNRDDSTLACNVASFLVVSLRDFYSKSGPPTIVHLLDEITVKFDIMKDLEKY